MTGPCKCPRCTMPHTCDGCGEGIEDGLVYEICDGKEVCFRCFEREIDRKEAKGEGNR